MPRAPSLRVCVDARVGQDGTSGGVEQIIIGLAAGLSALSDGDEEYFFLTYPEQKNRRLRARSATEDLRIRRELGYRVDWPVYRQLMYLLGKALRVCWKLATRCYW